MRRLLILALLLLAVPVYPQEDVPEVARTLLEEARAARDKRRVDDAIAKYRRVIEVAPQLASPYIDLGALLHDQRKADEAYRIFVDGIEHAPADRTLFANAATTALEIGKTDEALRYVDKAITINPRDATLYTLRGSILRALKRDEEGAAALQKAVQLAPNDARVNFALGNALFGLGQKDEAIAAYRKAIDIDPTMTRAYYNLGAVLFDVGRYNEALGAYTVGLGPIDKAFARNEPVDPIHARAYANLGAIYLRQQLWPQSTDAYSKALKLNPASANAHYNLGFIFYSTNRLERAEEEYRKALALDPALPLAYLHLAQMAMKKKDNAAAAKLLREGMPRIDAENRPVALRTLGRAELALGNTAAAAEALRENTKDIESAVMLARIDRREHRLDEAKALMDAAPSDNNAVLLERALIARDLNDIAGERAALEMLIAKSSRPELHLALALNLAREGRFDEAQKYLGGAKTLLGAAIKRDPKELQEFSDPLARGDLGIVLWQRGKADDARPHLLAALSANPTWSEVALALGDIALAAHDYGHASDWLTTAADNCEAAVTNALLIGKSDICARAKHDLAIALISEAAGSPPRQARSMADRAAQLDPHFGGAASYLRGMYALQNGDEDDARDSFTRALNLDLAPAAAAQAKKYLAAIAENAAVERTPEEAEPVATSPRRTVVVFLPDAAVENEKKLFETMSSFVSQLSSASGVPLSVEFFRRVDDARNFLGSNRDRVGIVIANPELISEAKPQFQFVHDGQRTYRRVIVVPAASAIKSMRDVGGRSLSVAEGLRDVTGSMANIIEAPDDLTALANVLTGKTEAALVSEANVLLAQNRAKLRVIYTSAPSQMPVIAFAPMLAADREALMSALKSMNASSLLAPLQVGLTAIERAPRAVAKRIDVVPISPRDLGISGPAEPPANLALRATLPSVTIADEMFDAP